MEHIKDTDCILDDTNTCTVCHVYHGEPCPECGQRGYHLETCSLCDVDCSKCNHVDKDCINGSLYLPCMPVYQESHCENFKA
jgi:hypothetical protein